MRLAHLRLCRVRKVMSLISRHVRCLQKRLVSSSGYAWLKPRSGYTPRGFSARALHVHSRSYAQTQTRITVDPSNRYKYPERLLIYNAGTGKTAFLGSIKLSTVFCFGFFTLIVAPSFYQAPDEPNWKAAAFVVAGAIPMLVVGYSTAPFVNSVYLRLPVYARTSKELLWRYSTHPPPDARLEFTTVRLSGQSKTLALNVAQLRPRKPRFGRFANLERIPEDSNTSRSATWLSLLGEPRNKFFIGSMERGMRNSHVPGVLENVLSAIAKRKH